MNDTREDQYLCPQCYVPVEYQGARFPVYTCSNCPRLWGEVNLIRASELERRIHEGEVNKDAR